MSWSPAFIEGLAAREGALVFRFERERIYNEPGRFFSVYSHGYYGRVSGVTSVSSVGQQVRPGPWTSRLGTFSVEVVGEAACVAVLQACARGTGVGVYAGWDGLPDSEWGRVALGVVRDIQVDGAQGLRLSVLCDDLTAACRQRFDPDATECALFSDQPAATTLAAGYTSGDSSLTVASATPFQGQTSGLLKMTGDSGEFYVRYTARSGTTVTVATTAYLGTMDDVANGAQVFVVAWVQGHPLKIAERILTSRDGTNGAQDVLPADWGMAIPAALVDSQDITAFQSLAWIATSGSYQWDVWSDVSVDDAYGWIVGWLSAGGGFLAMRQGCLTARCAQRPTYSCGLPVYPVPREDRIEGLSWRYNAFSRDSLVEYCTSRVISASSWTDEGGDDAATQPAERRVDHDLSAMLLDNQTFSREGDSNRLAIYDTRVPEVVTVQVRLPHAQRCIGDLLDLDTTGIPTRQRLRDPSVTTQLGVLTGISVDWSRGVVELVVFIYPPDEQVLS